jgi:thioredoxin-dependent peroxiredoxin
MAKITLGGNPTNTIGELPVVGSSAPNFKLVKADMSEASLSDFKGKKVILNIFPSVDTRVCAMSVRKFNQEASAFDNTVVLCISKDLPFAAKRFCGAEGLDNVITLSNFRDDHAFGKAYGVEILDGGFTGLDARAVVVIDETGRVAYTELVPEIGQEPNYEAALKAI